MSKKLIINLLMILVGSFAAAKESSMNDIKLSDFKNFEAQWHLVTVRFRKDSEEMRWTFANDQAWKTLSAGLIDYPDGAIFGKIGSATHEDAQFPSSAVPSGARRYQFMVRNKEKYKDTGGWGYALFDIDGNLFPDPIKETSMACFACHQIVENRGQVFSQPFLFSSDSKALIENTFLSEKKGFRMIDFKWEEVKNLPSQIKAQIPVQHKKIRILSNLDLRKNIFQGTLDEIRPRLEIEAYKFSTTSALISVDGKQFSLLVPFEKEGCKKNRSFRAISSLAKAVDGKFIQIKEYCNP